MISGLKVDPERMGANVDLTKGLIMAESFTMTLAPYVGRPEAQRIVTTLCERAVRLGVHLREVVLEEETVLNILSVEEIDRAFDPGCISRKYECIHRPCSGILPRSQGS